MKKTILYLLTMAFILFSCNQSNTSTNNSVKQKTISEKNKTIEHNQPLSDIKHDTIIEGLVFGMSPNQVINILNQLKQKHKINNIQLTSKGGQIRVKYLMDSASNYYKSGFIPVGLPPVGNFYPSNIQILTDYNISLWDYMTNESYIIDGLMELSFFNNELFDCQIFFKRKSNADFDKIFNDFQDLIQQKLGLPSMPVSGEDNWITGNRILSIKLIQGMDYPSNATYNSASHKYDYFTMEYVNKDVINIIDKLETKNHNQEIDSLKPKI